MSKKTFVYPIAVMIFALALGCHKKEIAPPPPPPAPPVVEKKVEQPVKQDDSEMLARQRRERLTKASEQIAAKVVYFDFDKSDIKPEYQSVLTEIAGILKENTELKLSIEGFCDERGTEAYNLALGERRATAAQEFLASAGVATSRINVKSWGEENPVADCHNESCWSKNRRDQFKAEF